MVAEPVSLPRLAERVARLPGERVLVGICGAPGAGKSTLADALVSHLNATAPGSAVVVGMDGFHLAASVIAGDDRATRRGAPDTFDSQGYLALLHRLRQAGTVYAPQYRREIEDPVAGAIEVTASVRVVVTEGNYLLLPTSGWPGVREVLDEVWYLLAPTDQLRQTRLIARHEQFGKDPAQAREHALGSDERNAVLVATHSAAADLKLRWLE